MPKADKPGAPLYRLPKSRIYGLDLLRGVCVLLMILDHLAFDVGMIDVYFADFYTTAADWLIDLNTWAWATWAPSLLRMVLRFTVICIFFTLSGISSSFSHNNALRGAKLAIVAFVLSLVTLSADNLFGTDIGILFGVLHCLAVSILLYAALEALTRNNALYACFGFGVLFFAWGLLLGFDSMQGTARDLSGHFIGFADFFRIAIGTRYYGADCFGLLPFCGIFLLGVCGGKLWYRERKPYLPLFARKAFRPLCFVGRHALLFYAAHQPVLLALVILVCSACGLHLQL